MFKKTVDSLTGSLKGLGLAVADRAKSDRLSSFLEVTISALKTTSKTLGKLAKIKYEKVQNVYNNAKTQALAKVGSLVDKAKELHAESKDKGMMAVAKDAIGKIADTAVVKIDNLTSAMNAPPEENKEPEEKRSWKDTGRGLLNKVSEKVSMAKQAIASFAESNKQDYETAKELANLQNLSPQVTEQEPRYREATVPVNKKYVKQKPRSVYGVVGKAIEASAKGIYEADRVASEAIAKGTSKIVSKSPGILIKGAHGAVGIGGTALEKIVTTTLFTITPFLSTNIAKGLETAIGFALKSSIKLTYGIFKEAMMRNKFTRGIMNKIDGAKDYLIEKKDAIAAKVKEKKDLVTAKISAKLKEKKDAIAAKLSPLKDSIKERSKGMWDKFTSRNKKREDEVEGEKKSVLDRLKDKSKEDSWIGKLLKGIMPIVGSIITGFKTVMLPIAVRLLGSIRTLGGFLVGGLGTVITNAVGGLGGLLLRGGGALLSGAGSLVTAAMPMLTTVGGMALRGAAMLATGPVGWAVAVGTIVYAGYKLYKYLNRNDVSNDIFGQLTLLRLLSYGFNNTNKSSYSKIFDLEMAVKDTIKFNKETGKAIVSKPTKEIIEKIKDIFGIDESDKDKFKILNKWYMNRFIPSFTAFLEALNAARENLPLEDLDKLKQEELEVFISKYKIPSSIYKQTLIPVSTDPETTVTKDEVESKLKEVNDFIDSKKTKKEDTFSNNISDIYNTTKEKLSVDYGKAKESLSNVYDKTKEFGSSVLGSVKDSMAPHVESIKNFYNDEKEQAKLMLATISNKMPDSVKNIAKLGYDGLTKEVEIGVLPWTIAIAETKYLGYKMIKFLNSNKQDDIFYKLTKLRLLTYGFNDVNKEYYPKIFDLEMIMKDYVRYDKDANLVIFSTIDSKAVEAINSVFNVPSENKDKAELLKAWFDARFIPAYQAFMQALYAANESVYLDRIEMLKDKELEAFINTYKLPTKVFNSNKIPVFDNPDSLVNAKEIELMYNVVSKLIREQVKSSADKDIKDNIATNKTLQEKKNLEANKTAKAIQEKPIDTKPSAPNTPANKPIDKTQEGEDKPKATDKPLDAAASGAADKLNKAPGTLMPGGTGLEGITTKLDKEKIYNLDPNVRELFTGMAKEYNSLTGKSVPVNEAFRSYEDQASLYKKYPDRAAAPGSSTHEFGLAIDVPGDTIEELDKLGLMRKYGFSTAVGGEKWHIEPIGVTINPTAAKQDPDFRTSAILASPGRGGGGYGLMDDSVLKKRNYPIQKAIFDSTSDTDVNLTKDKKPGTDPAIASAPKTLDEVNNKIQSKITDTASPRPTEAMSRDKPSTTETKTSVPKIMSPVASTAPISTTTPKTSLMDPSKDIKPDIGKGMDLGSKMTTDPITALKQASKMTGVDENTMISFAKVESSLNPNAGANTSSAKGLMQFTEPTWNESVKKYGDKYGIKESADIFNPLHNALMGGEYAKANLSKTKGYEDIGLTDPSALYLTHFMGPSGASNFISKAKQNPEAPINTIVSPDSYNANKDLFGNNTASSFVNVVNAKLEKASSTPAEQYKGMKSGFTTSGYGSSVSNINNSSSSTYNNTSSTTNQPAYTKSPVYSKPVSISSSNYEATTSTPKEKQQTNSAYDNMFDTSEIETTLTKQLDVLTGIASVLSSIDGKFDLEKMTSILGSITRPVIQQVQQTPVIDKSIPVNNSVNLSRKTITT